MVYKTNLLKDLARHANLRKSRIKGKKKKETDYTSSYSEEREDENKKEEYVVKKGWE
jgi:hypothetical protein